MVGITQSVSPHWEGKCSMLSNLPRIPILRAESSTVLKTQIFVAGPMRGSGTKPLEKFTVEQRQEIRSQATERTQLQDPIEEWTETNALSLKNALVGAANSNA